MTQLFGILNLSHDSFSDGGHYAALDDALEHARHLSEAGAHAVDIGAVSSNPDSAAVPRDVELTRLQPVLAALQAEGIRCSVDTFAPAVQVALAPRVAYLNDIRGFPDATIYPALAAASCGLIVMHALQEGPADRRDSTPDAVLDSIHRFFDARLNALVQGGVAEDRLVVDPGMGFFLGRNPQSSLAVLRALPFLRARYGRPVLVSVSRKSFLGALIGSRPPLGRAAATLAAELYAAREGVEYIRTHDVVALSDALTVERALATE